MAKARAIVKRLKAVRNIRKITRTMELVSTARFKKAMDRASEAAAYTRKIAEIVADVSASLNASGTADIAHPLLQPHATQKSATLLVITSNRGLCGGYNAGLLRLAQSTLRQLREEGLDVQLEVAGKRGINFFRFQRVPTNATYTQFEDKPTFGEVDEIASRYLRRYLANETDRLVVVYMQFESIARQRPAVVTLLPVGQLTDTTPSAVTRRATEVVAARKPVAEYEFLPSAAQILEELVPASFKARLFKCFLDAAVSEQIFRMVAMKSATENAGDMISTLKMQYNRARQSQITSELSEIIGGAAALE